MVNQKKQMSYGVILSYVSILTKLLSGILYTPIVLKSLGQSQYGLYSLCISFIGYLTIFNAGVNAAYIRFYVQEQTLRAENVEKLNGLFCKIFIFLSILGFAVGLLIAHFSPLIFGDKITTAEYSLVKKCFLLLSFSIAIEIFTCLFKSFITANEEFIIGKSLDIVGTILAPVLTIPFLLRGADCTSIISIRLCIVTLILFLNIAFCLKKLNIKFMFHKAESSLLKSILQFIGFITFQSIMDQLNWQIDKFILARTQGTVEVSVYSVGSLFNSYFLLISGAISGVFIAEINRLVAVNDYRKLNILFRKTSKLFTYIEGFIVTAFIIFGRSFILIWAGCAYDRSYVCAWLLMFPVAFALIMGLGQDIARAENKHQIQIVINICVCIVNMLISIPLAMYFGAVGSAFGTFLAEIIICVIVQPIYYKRVLNINVENIFLDILRFLPGLILPITFGIVIIHFGLLKVSYGSIMLHGIIFIVLYLISVILFSMNKDDRKYIFDIAKGRRKI